jgi:uncharacterized protein YyaL (SSP411 family)
MAEPKTKAAQINWLTDYEQALKRAKEENKPVFFDFWLDG